MGKQWLDYEEWLYQKNWYKYREDEWLEEYMKSNAGILEQIQNSNRKYYTELTPRMIEEFLEELSKIKPQESCGYIKDDDMNKNNKKKDKVNNDELIKSVFMLYKPNKVQRFFMSALNVGNKDWLIGHLLTGNINRTRTLCQVLSMTEKEVWDLQKKYYNV